MHMNKNEKIALPKLRFLQFVDAPAWNVKNFGKLSAPVTDRAGTNKYILMSVTSGIGLIPQIEKFGREIAGNAYSSYYVIKKNDFAYNKSATKRFPEGYISMLTEYEEAALPNSIFTCFRIVDEGCVPQFFDHLFHNNYHGSWLRKYIEVGARAHGSLSVDTKHLWNMPIALPRKGEQKKIADCLSSLDDLIAAENKKLDALRTHKKGLMQKLFPAESETVPEWRFPEFRNSGEWEERKFGELCNFIRGPFGGALKKEIFVRDGYAVYEQSHAIYGDFHSFRYYITEEKYDELKRFSVNANDIIMSCSGTMGKFEIVPEGSKEGVINQALLKLTVKKGSDVKFVKKTLELDINQEKLLSQSAGGAIKNVVAVSQMKEIPFLMPYISEQQKIANCLSGVDDLIAEQAKKIETLKIHKKGLMQGLFPSIEEVVE